MDGDNQPVAILPNIENDKAIDIVGVRKIYSQLVKVPPSSSFHDPRPCTDLLSCLPILFTRCLEALDRNDMHTARLLRKLRSVKQAISFVSKSLLKAMLWKSTELQAQE
jgi:hypothetical protein